MDLKVIENLLNLISESDVNEVSIEEGNFKIQVKKKPDVINQESSGPAMYMPYPGTGAQMPQPQAAPEQAPPQPAGGQAESSKAEASSANRQTITSPIVGTFYEAPSPDSKPYVQVGDTISKGDTICIVEAMKIMNEIDAEVSGKVVNQLVENGQPVEYDQPLYEVELSS